MKNNIKKLMKSGLSDRIKVPRHIFFYCQKNKNVCPVRDLKQAMLICYSVYLSDGWVSESLLNVVLSAWLGHCCWADKFCCGCSKPGVCNCGFELVSVPVC